MKVLAINCGSSTLKFDLIDTDTVGMDDGGARLAHGLVDRIGGESTLQFDSARGNQRQRAVRLSDHGDAARLLLEELGAIGLLEAGSVEAVGHRVVHGGDRFVQPVIIDEAVLSVIRDLTQLAPLHNGPALGAILATRTALGSDLPMVATFDTAFHHTLPERASRYAIPLELADTYSIRRYGFHGLAHRFLAQRASELLGRPSHEIRLITLQLGNGASAAAIDRGRSVDTSMGFTPLEGLMMGTRSGDVDPSLASFLAEKQGTAVDDAVDVLNKRSGLLGVSGTSQDMRTLLAAEAAGDSRAALAIEMFCYRVRKYVGAYLAVLGGADALVFGGGIGENAAEIRERICAGMGWCGLELDEQCNRAARGVDALISALESPIAVCTIRVDEALVIAGDTERCVQEQKMSSQS